jgi:molecular chaperone GrpE (heat shock protein)
MKANRSKKPAEPTATRKSAGSTPAAAGRKPSASDSRKSAAAKSPSQTSGLHETTGAPVSSKPDANPATLGLEILDEVRALRTALLDTAPSPLPASSSHADSDLESAVAAMRRLLSEWMERHTEQFLRELSVIRDAIANPNRLDPTDALQRIDRLFERLGASPFSPRKLDFVDPAIHEIVAERNLPDVPEGVVVETLRQGLRAPGGLMICKAWVAVNRRNR